MKKSVKISRFLIVASFVLVTIGFHATTSFAQHPCDAFPVTTCNIPSSFQVWSLNDNNATATGQTGEPRIFPTDTTAVNSLWYSWTAPANSSYILDTRFTNPNGANNFDPMIAVYTGSGSFANLTLVAKNDDWTSTQFPNNCVGVVPPGTEWVASSCLTFTAVAGTTYQFQVDGFSSQVGAFFLNLSFPPLSAEVSVGGRITDSSGNGVPRVRVSLTKSSGEILTVSTNAFGYYKFEGVEVGQNYTLQANSKRYIFQNNPRILSITEELQNENFVVLNE